MSKTWATSESRCGIWLGAKGLCKSGRLPLSGQGSGISRSDTPHPTIFCEVKRSKTYLTAVKLWEEYYKEDKKKKLINILTLPTVENNKVVTKNSDIWCFHNEDSKSIYDQLKNDVNDKLSIHEWKRNYPSVLTLYNSTISTWKNSILDRNKQIAHCAIFSHGKPGFWVIINKHDIIKWYDLVLESRIEREKLIKEEDEFIAQHPKPIKIKCHQKQPKT